MSNNSSKLQESQEPLQELPKGSRVEEIGGRRQGLDPTRYNDWELNGRAIDF